MVAIITTLKKLRSNCLLNPIIRAPFRLIALAGIKIPESLFRHIPFHGIMTVRVPEGGTFKLRGDGHKIENEIYWDGLFGHEPLTMRHWTELAANAEGVVLDIGANSGVFSLAASAMGASQVIAFEPLRRVADIARGNAALNPGFGIRVESKALGSAPGKALIFDPGGSAPTSASLDSDFVEQLKETQGITGGQEYKVQLTSVDDYVVAEKILKVALAKIDVEGFEHAVLRGMQETLLRDRPALIIEALDPISPEVSESLKKLRKMGYQVKRIVDFEEGPNRNLICTPC